MNIQFDCADKVNGLMTITIEQADYEEKVKKALNDYRKRAQVPGFRPGMVPMGLIKRQYGTAVKAEEVNRLLSDKLYEYIRENKIMMLGEPMPNEEKTPELDMKADGPFTFVFDIAVAPEMKAELSTADKVAYYDINIDDKMIDDQVEMYAGQAGEFVEAQEWSGNDTLTGDLRQLDAEGNTLEGGIVTEGAQVMPAYVSDDERKKFEGAKVGDIITFNPKKAYPDNDAELAGLMKKEKDEVKDIESDFSYQITGIRHFERHAVNQELFDRVLGKDVVSDEKAFREKVAAIVRPQLDANSDYRFMLDVRKYMEQKVGELTFPEALLKRMMLENNKDKGEDYVERNFKASIDELKWHLIKEQLVAANQIKIGDDDLKAMAKEQIREQFAQYGMQNVPEDVLEQYAGEQLKKKENVEPLIDRAVDAKLTQALKGVVTLDKKTVSFEEFNKMMREEK